MTSVICGCSCYRELDSEPETVVENRKSVPAVDPTKMTAAPWERAPSEASTAAAVSEAGLAAAGPLLARVAAYQPQKSRDE